VGTGPIVTYTGKVSTPPQKLVSSS